MTTIHAAPPARRAIHVAVALAVTAITLVAAACGSPAPSPAPGSTQPPADTPQAAADAVRARVPLFDRFEPRDPDRIGQASAWTAEPGDGGGWRVTFETGWGDCQAGCIDRHTWTWDVDPDGTLTFVEEAGSALDEATQAMLRASSTRTGVAGRATGGPTCPVETPGDPACAPRLVGGVVLVVTDAAGTQVATVSTDGSGYFRLALPAGDYTLVAPTADGFMSGPAPVPFTVAGGAETWLDLAWDTGIR